jgi:hypothetical protein
MTPEICPNCGALIPPNARACPECGSCEETGWSERAYAQGLELPDEEFDYDAFVQEEFGSGRPEPSRRRIVRWVAALLLGIFVLWYLLQ